jgi:hypothetical protein
VGVGAPATAGVTVGVGKIVHAMSHRESVLRAQSAAAVASHARAGMPSPRLGVASSPGAQAHGALGASAQGGGTMGPHRTVIGLRGSVGATGSRAVIIGRPGWPERSGNGASGQSDPGAAYASAGGYRWRGGPARVRSDPVPSRGASASGASGNAGSTHRGSAGSGTTVRGGSGKPSWAGSRHPGSQRASQRESEPSTGAIPVLRVNAPVPANVSGAVGKATSAVGSATTAVGSAATTAVGTATTALGKVTTTVGSATSTVAGALPVRPGGSTPSAPALPPLSLPDL